MIFAITVLAFATVTPSAQEPSVCDHVTRNVWDPRFTPGQRWSYRSRPVDAGSTLIITKIDDVPGIGPVVQIEVDHVDFFDRPPTPHGNNSWTQHLAIRRDSLDASVLEMLGIVALSNDSSSYLKWHMNCVGLTYGTTVADTLQTLQDEYLAKQATKQIALVLVPEPSGKAQKLTLTLSQHIINERSPVRELEGQLSFGDGNPVKNAQIEITPYLPFQQTHPLSTKTGSGGTFSTVLPPGPYNFKLTLDGYQSQYGMLNVSTDGPSLSNLHSGSY